MHPAQHTTIHRRSHAPVVSHSIGIECTHDDILDAIRQIASTQSSTFVMLSSVAFSLGLNERDFSWFQAAVKDLDEQGRICLSTLELPQKLPHFQAVWQVRNSSGVPCHEACIAPDSHRVAPLMREHAADSPAYPRAADGSTLNPTMQQRRISALVGGAAAVLYSMGSRPQTQFHVCHVEQPDTSTGRAA